MEGGGGGGEGGASGGRFPILQANRDPESNWELDVAKRLQEYLLKICSGEVEDGAQSVNFAEGEVGFPGLGFLAVNVQAFFMRLFFSWVMLPERGRDGFCGAGNRESINFDSFGVVVVDEVLRSRNM